MSVYGWVTTRRNDQPYEKGHLSQRRPAPTSSWWVGVSREDFGRLAAERERAWRRKNALPPATGGIDALIFPHRGRP